MKKGICFIIVYFGSWPPWFTLFLNSCKNNTSVNFLIFTDCEIPGNSANNIKFISFSLKDFDELCSLKLKRTIKIGYSYKLCDYKPLFGFIFNEYIKDFLFWGNCDIDLLFGNFEHFITDNILNEHDIITSRTEYLAGHCTLYRNTRKINLLFKKSKDHTKIFRTDRYLGFDECGRLWNELLNGSTIKSLSANIESMTHVLADQAKICDIRCYFHKLVLEQDQLNASGDFEEFKDVIYWKNGRIFSLKNQREYLYFHFHFLKKNANFIIPDWPYLPDRFFINKDGMFTSALPVSHFESIMLNS